ncbi:MAG: DUF4214 domain-containing protein [Pseudomonadota bacterium]
MPTPTTGSPIVITSLTGAIAVDSLLNGFHWSNSSISYSFIVPGSSYYATNYPDTSLWTATEGFNLTQQSATQRALSAWSNVANISFQQYVDDSTSAGTIRFAFSSSNNWGNSAGETYLPNISASGGDVWLDPAANNPYLGNVNGTFIQSMFSNGTYVYYSLLHEIGHALGLKHPFDISTNGGCGTLSGTSLSGWDSRQFTLMSYTALATKTDAIGITFNPTTPMLLDILAIQSEYGANNSYNSGDTVYNYSDDIGKYYNETIWDGGGNNSISYSGSHASLIDLNQGHGSTIGNSVYAYTNTDLAAYQIKNVWIAYGVHINSATVSGNAPCTIIANDDGCTLRGGNGSDYISGGSGNDSLVGNGGNDVIDGGSGVDIAIFSGNRVSYNIIKTPAGIIVTDLAGANGVDTLNSVEFVQFNDGTYLLSTLLDITPPSAPSLLVAKSSTGYVIGNHPVFYGNAEPEATVQVFNGLTSLGIALTNVNGLWSLTSLKLDDGIYNINAQAVDSSGNISKLSEVLKFGVDVNAPSAPTIFVVKNAINFIAENQPIFSGNAEIGSLVKLFYGTELIGQGMTNANGSYSITTNPLHNGNYAVTAFSEDLAGNISTASNLSANFSISSALNSVGTSGRDTFSGLPGNNNFDGGNGIDTLVYDIPRGNVNISVFLSGYSISDIKNSTGIDVIENIERIKFSDVSMAFDISGNAGSAYRIYQAAFNRAPDLVGLGYWINALDIGITLNEVAAGFVSSTEFKMLYGVAPTNAQIVDRLYQNVLHRIGDAGGTAFWSGALDSHITTIPEILAAFSESPENQAALIGVIGNGFIFTPFG